MGNQVARRDYANGVGLDLVYDGLNNAPGDFGLKRIVESRHSRIADGSLVEGRGYTWNRAFRKTSRTDLGSGASWSYAYDSAYRLTESQRDDAGAYTMSAAEPADASMNQYTTTSFDTRGYDLNGNLKQSDYTNYLYDYRSRCFCVF